MRAGLETRARGPEHVTIDDTALKRQGQHPEHQGGGEQGSTHTSAPSEWG